MDADSPEEIREQLASLNLNALKNLRKTWTERAGRQRRLASQAEIKGLPNSDGLTKAASVAEQHLSVLETYIEEQEKR